MWENINQKNKKIDKKRYLIHQNTHIIFTYCLKLFLKKIIYKIYYFHSTEEDAKSKDL